VDLVDGGRHLCDRVPWDDLVLDFHSHKRSQLGAEVAGLRQWVSAGAG
jgi:hypothetical protein